MEALISGVQLKWLESGLLGPALDALDKNAPICNFRVLAHKSMKKNKSVILNPTTEYKRGSPDVQTPIICSLSRRPQKSHHSTTCWCHMGGFSVSLSICLSPPSSLLVSALFIPPNCGRLCRLAKINGQRFGGVILERRKEGCGYEALPQHNGLAQISIEKHPCLNPGNLQK